MERSGTQFRSAAQDSGPKGRLVLYHLGGHVPGDIAHATGADIATIRSLITATTPHPGA